MVIALSLLASILMWCAFQPLGLWPLVFVAALLWMPVIADPKPLSGRSYQLIYVASAVAWLLLLQGIRLAYWPLYAGWIALALYVAVYIPLFVYVSRCLVHRYRWPLVIATPLVWIGCELLRCYMLTGFGGCLLGHTLAEQPALIQWAAHFGPYGVGAWIILAGASLYSWLTLWPAFRQFVSPRPVRNTDGPEEVESDSESPNSPPAHAIIRLKKQAVFGTIACLALLVGSYWQYYAGQAQAAQATPLLKVALIQENMETRFDEYVPEKIFNSCYRYAELTYQVGKEHSDLDLVVWPESVYNPAPEQQPYFFTWDGQKFHDKVWKYGGDPQTAYDNARFMNRYSRDAIRNLQFVAGGDDERPRLLTLSDDLIEKEGANQPALLLGTSYWEATVEDFRRENSAVFLPKSGGDVDVYGKRYLVMFGEYIPFASGNDKIYQQLGMMEINTGREWKSWDVDGVKVAPSICFEDMLPQAIQNQVAMLTEQQQSPDILVNVTNDGWFRGSSMLDHHFACAVFSAVENRRPMLVAANTGISCWISGNGTVPAKAERLQAEAVVAEPVRDSRWGLWQMVGDWPARLCGGLVVIVACLGYFDFARKSLRDRWSSERSDA